MEKIEEIIEEINKKEKKAKKKALWLTLIPVIIGLSFIIYSVKQVINAQEDVEVAQGKYNGIIKGIDSLERLRDSFRIEFLEAKGFNFSLKKDLLKESIKANELLSDLLQKDSTNKNLRITYYRKTLDQQKVWFSLNESGYQNIGEEKTTNPYLTEGETNAVVIGSDVLTYDLKIIILTLIRAGLKIQHIELAQKNPDKNLVQIIRIAPRNGPDNAIPINVEQINQLATKEQLIDLLRKQNS